jgi:hypothetical protein
VENPLISLAWKCRRCSTSLLFHNIHENRVRIEPQIRLGRVGRVGSRNIQSRVAVGAGRIDFRRIHRVIRAPNPQEAVILDPNHLGYRVPAVSLTRPLVPEEAGDDLGAGIDGRSVRRIGRGVRKRPVERQRRAELARDKFAAPVPAWDTGANASHDDALSRELQSFTVNRSEKPDLFNSLLLGNNILAIHGLNYLTTSSDFLISGELYAGK